MGPGTLQRWGYRFGFSCAKKFDGRTGSVNVIRPQSRTRPWTSRDSPTSGDGSSTEQSKSVAEGPLSFSEQHGNSRRRPRRMRACRTKRGPPRKKRNAAGVDPGPTQKDCEVVTGVQRSGLLMATKEGLSVPATPPSPSSPRQKCSTAARWACPGSRDKSSTRQG